MSMAVLIKMDIVIIVQIDVHMISKYQLAIYTDSFQAEKEEFFSLYNRFRSVPNLRWSFLIGPSTKGILQYDLVVD